MSTCIINAGMAMGCRDNAGGIVSLYLANYPTGITSMDDYSTVDAEEIITAFTYSGDFSGFYEYKPNKTSSDFTETYQVSLENGTVGYEQKVNAVFSKLSAEKRLQIKSLTAGNFLLIAKDKNGKFWLIGAEDSVNVSGGNAGTGKALSDLNGYTLEFTALEGKPAFEVDENAITLL
jgi:hypothetical protein